MEEQYDLIAIGAGPAGQSAAELAADFGYRAAVIEKASPGGTVTTTGGVPTKTLREAALYFSGLHDGEVYGLHSSALPNIAIDIIRQRTWDVCETLQKATLASLASHGVSYIAGTAHLLPGGKVQVEGVDGETHTLSAKMILVACGSRPLRPENIPFQIEGVCDTDTILYRGRVPQNIVIVGSGPVGVEFATICHALGAKVTLVERGTQLLQAMDDEICARLAAQFKKWDIKTLFETTVENVSNRNEDLQILLSTGETHTADTLLFAAGRVANTEGLGLSESGVATDDRGRILVDSFFRTSAPGVYAVGDAVRSTLASVAMEQGRIAVCHHFGIPFEGTIDPTPVSAVYSMPEVSGTGMTEEECQKSGFDYAVGRCDLMETPRGVIAGHGGLLKIIFHKHNRKILGVHCIGDLASEIVGIGQMLIRCGGTMNTLATLSFNTPTYSYAYKYAALDGLRRQLAVKQRGTYHEQPRA